MPFCLGVSNTAPSSTTVKSLENARSATSPRAFEGARSRVLLVRVTAVGVVAIRGVSVASDPLLDVVVLFLGFTAAEAAAAPLSELMPPVNALAAAAGAVVADMAKTLA